MHPFQIVAVLCLIVSAHKATGQSHGYLGKPLSIQYEFVTTPNLLYPNANDNVLFEDGVSLNSSQRIAFQYQTGRKSLIGAALGYGLTGINPGTRLRDAENSQNFDRWYNAKFHQIRVLSAEVRYTRFFKTIAPVGAFWSAFISVNKSDFRGGILTARRGIDPQQTIEFKTDSRFNFYAGLRLGRQKILFDRIPVSYSLEVNTFSIVRGLNSYVFDADPYFLFSGSDSHSKEASFIEESTLRMKKRVSIQNLILFNLSFWYISAVAILFRLFGILKTKCFFSSRVHHLNQRSLNLLTIATKNSRSYSSSCFYSRYQSKGTS